MLVAAVTLTDKGRVAVEEGGDVWVCVCVCMYLYMKVIIQGCVCVFVCVYVCVCVCVCVYVCVLTIGGGKGAILPDGVADVFQCPLCVFM
jgi:hypothetical protein